MAQHHGVPTQLLDWTGSIPIAAFFAVEDADYDGDSCIIEISGACTIENEWHSEGRKFENYKGTAPQTIKPKHSNDRIAAQHGYFTIHPDPFQEFDREEIVKYIIPKLLRPEIRTFLSKIPIDRSQLFPDFDGIAKTISESYEARE